MGKKKIKKDKTQKKTNSKKIKNKKDEINEDINNKKSKIKNKKTSKIKTKGPTLLDLIKTKNEKEVELKEEFLIVNGIKENQNAQNNIKTEKNDKNEQKIKSSPININKDNSEYLKKIKPRVVMKDGKIIIERPDVGLINKQFNEELNKNLFPIQKVSSEKKLNSLSFTNFTSTKKWKEEETNLFYKALEVFGLDFSFLEMVLKPRTRKEIKNKYYKEQRDNPEKLEKAINCRKNLTKMKEILKAYTQETELKEKSFDYKNIKKEKVEENNEENIYKNILLK